MVYFESSPYKESTCPDPRPKCYPVRNGRTVELEHGMQVTFDTSPLFSREQWRGWTKLKPQSNVSNGEILNNAGECPGLYKIRHSKFSRLVYIGESGNIRGRMSQLAVNVQRDKMPYRDPHTAAMSLWSYKNEYGGDFEVSWIEPSFADRRKWRKGMEAALLALYRLKNNHSTICNYGRIHPGYKKSRKRATGIRGCKSGDATLNRDQAKVHPRSSWYNYHKPRSKTWMGYHWSERRKLRDSDAITFPDNIIYRLTRPEEGRGLTYIGETSNARKRMDEHYEDFGAETRFEYMSTKYLDSKSRRLEVETDLIGVHYLLYGNPPTEQFGDEYTPRSYVIIRIQIVKNKSLTTNK